MQRVLEKKSPQRIHRYIVGNARVMWVNYGNPFVPARVGNFQRIICEEKNWTLAISRLLRKREAIRKAN